MSLHSLVLNVANMLQFLVLRDTLAVTVIIHNLVCLNALQINIVSLCSAVNHHWMANPILRVVLVLVVLLCILVNLEFVNLGLI